MSSKLLRVVGLVGGSGIIISSYIYHNNKSFSSTINKSVILSRKTLVKSKNPHIDDYKLFPTKTLSNGNKIPILGFGTWELGNINDKFDEKVINDAISHSISIGYRHIDCAQDYLNEHLIGNALNNIFKNTNIKRNDLFITSKLNQPYHKPEHIKQSLKKTLYDLNLDYLDLYLIHYPLSFEYVPYNENMKGYNNEYDPWDTKLNRVSIHDTWNVLEELYESGLIKNIGVSNFNVQLLNELLSKAKIKPVINQVEYHPFLNQEKLKLFCNNNNILIASYSPLGTPGNINENEIKLLYNNILNELAEKYNVSPAQIALKWNLNKGNIVITKSNNKERISENHSLLSFELSNLDMELIDNISKQFNYRYLKPEDWDGPTKNIPIFN